MLTSAADPVTSGPGGSAGSAVRSSSSSSAPARGRVPGGPQRSPHQLADLESLPEDVRKVLEALRPAHISEVAAAVAGGDMSMQYEMDSGFAAAFASVLTCALVLGRGSPRPAAQLWEFDWRAAGAELEPAEDFVAALLRVAARLARGGKLEDAVGKALWREMNRLPELWSGAPGAAAPCDCDRLPGLERLRRCIRAIAVLAAPR
mmetsp:Transcript_22356/g.62471  ORF Transcript_22356/g.62471 Transcript_22356/m.62471 type:complete len:205 (+) Transcript_22356:77-691(+)